MLSAGHTSLTLYIQLFLAGYGLEIEDLEALRTWGSKTPGHPEYRHTRGVEITTGPLGQGIGASVGMAMAARRERGLLDPDAPPGQSPFDHHVFVISSDGDMMEGVSSEASSLAGHQELGNLIVFYDQNHISIEDDTDVSFSEDVGARYAAYGWHVQKVDWRGQHGYTEDVDALLDAIEAAKAETGRPSIIVLNTIIGWPAPTKQNTGKAHGAALGADEVAATKKLLGFDPEQSFAVEEEVLRHAREVVNRGRVAHEQWNERYQAWRAANPDRAALLDRLRGRRLPAAWADVLPVFEPDRNGMATRKASGVVLSALAPVLPELWGGSADLAESNLTTMDGADSFIPPNRQTKEWHGGPYGRTLHFGIREHAMAAALNGIALQSLTRAYGGTFLTFSDYMRPAVRLAALMQLGAIYVWTHDSIGLGEDGPTHQPIEQLTSLRNIPGLDVVRPGDANETSVCWRTIIEQHDRPAGLVLQPAERSRAGARRLHRLCLRGGRRARRLHPGRGVLRLARRAADRDWIRGAAGAGRAGPAGSRRHRRAGRLDALPGVVRRAGPGLPRHRAAAGGARPGQRRGRCHQWLAGDRRRRRAQHRRRALRRVRRLQDHLPRVRRHGRGRRGRRAGEHARRRARRPARRPPRHVRPDRGRDCRPPRLTGAVVPRLLTAPSEGRHFMTSEARHDPLAELSALGVAVWLDDLSRELLAGGELQRLIDERHVVGVTTNPTIFAAALSKGDRYDDQLRELAVQGAGVETVVFRVTTDDVRAGCDVFTRAYQRTGGQDGRVSIEVDPRLAHDVDATVTMARALRDAVGRDNMFVKIPATREGLAAITQAIAEGISVNVTLIFSLDRYRAVMDAYLAGLEQTAADGRDLAAIRSVASFFVSRVDTEVDARLERIGTDEALRLRGKAAIANARLAYQAFQEVIGGERWSRLAAAGGQRQRPLWASTGVKNPAYPDTMYVTELVAPDTVNTMPGPTLEAFAGHGEVKGDTITGRYDKARQVMERLAAVGIDFADVTEQLERDGVEKFEKSWSELAETVAAELDRNRGASG